MLCGAQEPPFLRSTNLLMPVTSMERKVSNFTELGKVWYNEIPQQSIHQPHYFASSACFLL